MILLAAILCVLMLLQLLWPVITGHPIVRVGDGVNVSTYGFDLSTSLVPRDQIVASGISKDGLHAMIDPRMLTMAQQDQLGKAQGRLVSADLVIGVAGGPQPDAEARAYPLATLDLHEIINDTIAGRAIAVTYNPLCASCAVFVRPANTVFGFSGLLYQSNLLMYDRAINQTEIRPESLWSQLQFRAITGPAAARGATLALAPFELTTWADWEQRHPNTLILARDPSLGDEYNHNRYGSYFASDEIKFPVDPLWNNANLAKKTRVLAVRINNQWTLYTLPKLIASAGASGRWSTTQSGVPVQFAIGAATHTAYLLAPPPDAAAIPCFLFAWYAQHPNDLRLIR